MREYGGCSFGIKGMPWRHEGAFFEITRERNMAIEVFLGEAAALKEDDHEKR
ncbi:MAG: hypothetical protein ABII06_08555 [Pseudomonadota bacterium]